ncbi:MAG: CRP/FNR family transcriptional regulator [Oceanospirillaceae bacterium]|jgi:CRP/FNR family transcriptional regulator
MAVSLDMTELSKLDDIVDRSKPLSKGEMLCNQGDKFHTVFAIKSGSIKTYITSCSGEEQITGFYFPGDLVGLNAIDSGVCQDSMKVLETTTVCQVQFEQLDGLSTELPKLRRQLLKTMSKEICNEQHMLQLLAKKNADERIATFLLRLSNRFKTRGFSETRFRLSMSRHEIGNYLGLTVETVSRVLTRLQKNDYITVENKEIELLNIRALLNLTQGKDE